ncbi:MAG TPA: DUF3189 family protein [Firmicutes bacterium]|nr:DUF3189 family protein [Bacillota bacterium]
MRGITGAVKVIYHCYGRAHSSVVAAHLHLGNLPMAGPVSIEQLIGLAEFDRADPSQWGIPYLMGRDERGNEVYILGLDSQTPAGLRAITSLTWHLGKKDEIFLCNTLPAIGLLTRLGGFTSKKLGLTTIGRPLAAFGIILSLERLRGLVAWTKGNLSGKAGRC